MAGEWHETTLGKICQQQGGSIQTGPFGSQLHASDYTTTGTPVVMPVNLIDGNVSEQGIARVSGEMAKKMARHKLKPDDIVFSRRGDVTRFALVSERETGWLCGTGCLKVSLGKPTMAVPEFIAATLASPEAKEWLLRHAVGATMPNLNTEILGGVPTTLPSLETQVEIGNFLKALKDRIDNLRQTNATLEAIAATLFKSWFVDFDGIAPEDMQESELGLIPKGWRVVPAGEIYDVGIGKTPPRKEQHWFTEGVGDVPWVSIRDMGDSGLFVGATSEYLTHEAVEKFNIRRVPAGTVLLSFKLTVGRLVMTDTEMTTNEAIAHFKEKSGSPSQCFLYCYLKQYDFSRLGSTSSIATATNSKAIRELPILLPNQNVVAQFNAIVLPLFQQIRNQQQQVATLTTLRDTLLPRLISGRLRLNQ